jgi:peroxiredoxin
MNRKKSMVSMALLGAVLPFVLCECAAPGELGFPDSAKEPSPPSAKGIVLPLIELPIPEDKEAQEYLGVSGTGKFNLSQIEAPLLIIEVFSMYCPHCQSKASLVNELYRAVEKDRDLKKKIRILGIGAKNTAFEVKFYKEMYEVPFPLFPDEDTSVYKKLGVKGTPSFIGIRINGEGSGDGYYFDAGALRDINAFLRRILKASGLE